MGKSQSTVANKMRLLTLTNEVQMALMNNLISERHARCLLQIKDTEKQKEVLNKIITERMNVRDTDDYIKNMLGIEKVDMPIPEQTIVHPVAMEEPKIELPNIPNPGINLETPSVDLPKIEDTVSTVSVNIPKIEEPISSVEEETKVEFPSITPENKEENPNVYEQSNSRDFIDISSLNGEIPTQNPVKSALNGLNIVSTESDVFVGSNLSVEEKDDSKMSNIETPIVNNEINKLFKLKLATAIKLAKDSVEEIKKAGYNVKLEEIDSINDYQIIIKVEK